MVIIGYERGKEIERLPLARTEDLQVGDKVAWNVYGWHTGTVVGILEEDVTMSFCDSPIYDKGDVKVLCDDPWFRGQTVVLKPGRTMRKL